MNFESVLTLLAATSVKGSLVLGLVLAVAAVARRSIPARWMHLLLLVGVLRLLLPVAPASPVSIFNLGEREELARPILVSATAPSATAVNVANPTPPARSDDSSAPLLATVLFALWATGVAVVVLRTLRNSTAAQRLASRATPLPQESAAVALLDESRALFGVRRTIRLAVGSSDSAPAMHGVLSPTLVLPSQWEESLSLEQLRFVFLHELAHLRRLDVLVNWVSTAAHALHWFNPLVRLALTRLAEERELACDALALEHLAASERRAYGGTVLQLLDQWRLHAPVPGIVGMASPAQLMKRRIQMITAFQKEKKGALWVALVSLLAVVSLTDAQAGDRQVHAYKIVAPDAQAVAAQLETAISFDLASASVEDVMHAISNRTGATITIADGALDQETRDARLNLKADQIPAHIVLFETVGALDLAVRFSDRGAEVIKADDEHAAMRFRMIHPSGDGEQVREKIVIRKRDGEKATAADDEAVQDRVVIRRHGGEATSEAELEKFLSERRVVGETLIPRKRIFVDAKAEDAGPGVSRRRVTFRGGEEGQADGTLELEVRRANAS